MKKTLMLSIAFHMLVAHAQNSKIDSLQKAIKNFETKKIELHLPATDEGDTVYIKLINLLSYELYLITDFEGSKKYADEALVQAEQMKFKSGLANAYNNIGNIQISESNFPDALKNYNSALEMNIVTGDKKGQAGGYINIGNVNKIQGNNPEALKNYLSALKIYEEINDKKSISICYNNIGNIYAVQGNDSDALQNYYFALRTRESIDDKRGIASTHMNIGNIYIDQKKFPQALNEFFLSFKISKEIGNKVAMAGCYINIGIVYDEQGKYPEALKNYFDALKILEEMGNKFGMAECYMEIGTSKLKMHDAIDAKVWLSKSLKLSQEIGSLESIKDSYEALSKTDSALGNYKNAYENHKCFIIYRDSLENTENTKKLMKTKMQYEFDKKETQIKILDDVEIKKQMLVRNVFIGGFAVVLAFAGVFFRQRNRTNKEKHRSDALLLNILPGEVAEEIKNNGTAKAKAFTMVTVMFTDFKDFTTVSEKVSAELLVDEIHTCFSAFDNILQKYRIEKIKTIGDAYLCASGLPVSNYTHAPDMINAAIEIRNFMLERKIEKELIGEIPFELRIGIHTGPVVAGVVGVKKYAYDIWGDTVNIAARMEQNSDAGKINISGVTYELVKAKFKCEHRGKIEAKNKGEIDMYFVMDPAS
jgi:adenylate cyclase